jgi:hypothetical protein
MQGFYFTTRITTQNSYIIDCDDSDNNNKDDDDEDKWEYVCLRFKFEIIKLILQNVQSTYLCVETQG